MLGFFSYTERDLATLSWSFVQVRQIRFALGGFGDSGDVAFDVDYVTSYNSLGTTHAPARLTFRGLTDLKVNLIFEHKRFQDSPVGWITSVTSERIQDQLVYLDRPYYSWVVKLCHPFTPGEITFGAYGFTLRQTGLKRLRRHPKIPAGISILNLDQSQDHH